MKTDVLIRIGGLPWSESKVLTDVDPANIGKIAKDAEIDWAVNAEALTAPLHGVVPGHFRRARSCSAQLNSANSKQRSIL